MEAAMQSGAERQAAYRKRKLGKRGDGVRLDLIVTVHAAAVLKRLARRHRVTEAVALAMALDVADASERASMTKAERAEYNKPVRVGGVNILP
jgi:hypothetical protein